MSATAGTIRAMTAGSRSELLRLWGTSGCVALLLHLALVALLFVQRNPRAPAPSSGTLTGLDIDIASPPAAPPAARVSAAATQPPSVLQFKSLPEMAVLTSDTAPPPPPPAASTAATALPSSADSLAPIAPFGELHNSQASDGSRWSAELRDQLARYRQYPAGARRKGQQDTVRLQFSVDRAGRVTHFRIDSTRHYKALEQEVRHMLQLAAPFPTPPPDLSVDALVINTDVDFSIIARKPAPLASRCSRPVDPGPAPAGAASTLEQMRTYQDHLRQYVAATRGYLDCLAPAGAGASPATPEGNAAVTHLNTLVQRFNTQAQLFRSAVDARAVKAQLQAQQAAAARLAQARAAAATAYAACAAPPAAVQPRPITTLTADTVPAYRKRLVAYVAAVHSYVACIDQARGSVLAQAGDGLTAAQRSELDVDAANIGNAVIDPLNQLVTGFNARLRSLQQRARAVSEQNLAQALARATAILADSTWNVPAPLPRDECIRITRSGQSYQARLCRDSYVTSALAAVGTNLQAGAQPGDAALAAAMQIETIAAAHGVAGAGPGTPILGIAATPHATSAARAINHPQTTSYTVGDLHVAGRQVSFTIHARSDGGPRGAANGSGGAIYFDLALSPDGQSLRGRCSTGSQRWNCELSRHP